MQTMAQHARLSPPPANIEHFTRVSIFTLNLQGTQGLSTQTAPPHNGRIRWAILASASLVMFGNYCAFDKPATLNKPLQDYMAF